MFHTLTWSGGCVVHKQCDGWEKTGSEHNFYYATADASRRPCEFYGTWRYCVGDGQRHHVGVRPEGYPTLKIGKNEWLYNTTAYKEGPIDPSVFTLPSWAGACPAACKS